MSRLPLALLPGDGWRSALPWLAAAAVFLMVLAAAATLALGHAAAALGAAAGDRLSIILPAAAPARADALADRTVALLTGSGMIVEAKRVSSADLRRLIPAAGAALPILIEVVPNPGVTPSRLKAVLRTIPDVTIAAEADALGVAPQLVGRLRTLAICGLLTAGLIIIGATMLTARATLSVHSATVATLHGMGATDLQIARLLERRSAIEALIGGAVGFAAGAVAILATSHVAPVAEETDLFARPPISIWVVMILLPPLASLLALVTSRAVVLFQLRRPA